MSPLTTSAPDDEPAGDARFNDLLRKYGRLLHAMIVQVCPPALRASCDDLEQEARISLWKALKGEREIAWPVSYIKKVAVSVTLRAIRRAKARAEEALPDGEDADVEVHPLYAPPPPSPETVAQLRECKEKLDAALRELPENRRRAVELHLRDMNSREIGKVLGWSEAKARNLVSRGRKDLRNALRKLGIEYDG